MDLSLLPTPASEYNRQRAGALFTVRSASSPSYSLTRRPGVRKPRGFLEEDRGGSEEAGEFERYVTQTGAYSSADQGDHKAAGYDGRSGSLIGQREEKDTVGYKMLTSLDQNGTADKTVTAFGLDRSASLASESRGRTEIRRYNLPSRSKSLDWRAGQRSPDRGKRTDMFVSSTGRTWDMNKLDERTGVQGPRGRVMSSMQAHYSPVGTSNTVQETSPVSHMGQAWDRTSRGHSLPSRLRSQSGPCSNVRVTSASFGSKGGQSILERIEKLYGSAGFGKMEGSATLASHYKDTTKDSSIPQQPRAYEWTSGGTFPRRFSSGQTSSLLPVQSRSSFTWTQRDSPGSDSLFPTNRTRERAPLEQRYGQTPDLNLSGELGDIGTMSLDRARSRNTVAARIRAARAAEETTPPPQSHTSLHERSSVSLRDWSGLRERRLSGSADWSWANHREENQDVNVTHGSPRERTGWLSKQEPGDGVKEKAELKGAGTDEDVFESNLTKTSMKSTEKKKFPEVNSAAGVRNKINQFEALSQRVRGLATGQVLMPRRAFSVPTQLSKAHGGEKKNGPTIGLKDKWGGLKDVGEKSEEIRAGKKLGSERSLSVNEAGLRLKEEEREEEDLIENEEKETDKGVKDCGKYSRVKSTLEIQINGDQQGRCNFYIDESDFSKLSSPDEAIEKPTSVFLSDSSDTPDGIQRTTPTVVASPDSDDDKTPTNTPHHLPLLIPSSQPQNSTPIPEKENDSTPVLTQAAKTSEADILPLPHPVATPPNSDPSDLASPAVNEVFPKGKNQVLDLDAWVAGLNPMISVWNDEDYEDDDDESTQKDEDSNYDSDSGESSVTITSNMSQSDRKSFCVSLSDLCNFAGVDYESENDSDDWQSLGRRSASLSSDMSALSYVSVMPTEELDKLLEDVRSLGDSTLQDYNDVQVAVLHKEVGVGLGFSLAGGIDQNKPVTVHKVFHSGVAAQEGSIKEGDQVLSINGTALGGYAHWEALRVLRRAKTRDLGVVVLRRGGISSVSSKGSQTKNQVPKETQASEAGQLMCVRLEKNSRDLGFSLEGGVGSSQEDKPLTVQKIFQGGPVEKVCPGDEVVEIEGVSMVGMRRLEAWTFIRRLPSGPVDVVLRRPQHLDT
ncbi:uncharacterized protein si:dkey-92i15.4 [Xyrichtys novacula]|uniref:Uncharacterized protein si:dkey-92i15.4 n=1 Tax=Xyrichtys novacula TaxID=13765 RepID=A0AAV1FN93_XYRNO|nr:uncharacterized protein si:dkey-92i15.4 [Xyrichtys novacula]